ncbi:hypothetical protein [Aureispira anguillae]|uniref:Uncharacterized protein n=1 Tax=Aureispira anguillae TaxID=2864201 RepID=A0A915YC16_9BACT|nr:hypothetical protein [Aureispira anguillae]BDS10258.1 hypothetical protein AsAng_0009660 [Aureispira anguillae]
MTNFSNQGYDPVVVQRVLDFLNAAETPADISAISYLHDQLNLPNAYEIGEVVAQRILEKRKKLPDDQFVNLNQLDDVQGFGVDKLDSLIQAFSERKPAKARSFPTVDLFRFTTFRQPEKVIRPAVPFAYVQYNHSTKQTSKAKQETNELPSSQAFVEQFDALWAFSHWLYENKASFHLEALEKKINLKVYQLDEAAKIWAVLLAEIRLQQDVFLRQACLELLVGHNFLAAYQQATREKATDLLQDIDYWRRIAKATVILPKELFNGQQAISNNQLKQGDGNTTQNKQYSKIHQALIATQIIDQQVALKEEFSCLQPVYEAEKEAAEKMAFERYKKEIEPLEQQLAEILESFMDQNQLSDLDEATLERIYRKVNIPEFRFSFPNSLSKEFTKGKLSKTATNFIANHKLENKELITAINLLEQQEKISQKQLAGRYQKFVKEIFAYSTAVKPRIYHAFNFSWQEDLLAQKHFYFSFNAGYTNAHIKALKASLTIGEKTQETEEIQLLSNESEVLLLELFSGFSTDKLNPNTATGKLNIKLQLDNGQQFELEKAFHLRSRQTSGVLYPFSDLLKAKKVRPTDLYGITQLGIADFRKVEQNLCCYVPGEVSHIENVMAREYKEKATRNLMRSENTFETTTEKEVEELNDTTTTTRFEMNSEVANVINRDRSSNYGFNASVNGKAKLFGQEIGFNVGGYGDFSFATSSQNSNTTARTYAEDVTRRALERIVQKTSTKRTSTVIKEFEQNYKHGYDNREGKEHVTGVYRWVDKIYKNRVVNYGKRLMYEFMLPEPARFFYQTIYEKANDNNNSGGGDPGAGIDVPVKPTAPTINSHLDITRDNYAQLAASYGANVDAPMNPTAEVNIPVAESIGGTDQAKTFSYQTLQIPTNYQCHYIQLKVTFGYQANWFFGYPECYFRASFAGKNWSYPSALQGTGTKSNVTKSYNLSPKQTGMIPVVINTRRIKNYNGTVRALCQLDPQVYEQWQQSTYQSIMDAYDAKLQAYNAAVAAQQAANDAAAAAANAAQDDDATNPSHNSAMNLEIITTELKRLCIEMMTRPFGLPMGQGFYGSTCNDIPSLNLGTELDRYSAVVKFFEQAFDWQLMAYTFYAYYWADKCTKWQDLLQRQNGVDHIFQRFIQSGMSRLVVPVREGFEKAVLYFMETGQVWNGLDVIVDMNNPLYLSILEELEEPTGDQVGEPWYTTVPSTLNIIQGRSAYLNETGLPCCGELESESGGTNLLGSNEKLKGLKE